MILDPLAKFCNPPEQYEKLKNFVDDHNNAMNKINSLYTNVAVDEKQIEKDVDKAIKMIDSKLKKAFQ